MKILVLSGLLVRFAVVDFVLNVNVNVEAFAFKSSSRVLPLSVIDRVPSTNFHRYHHLGDLEHDALPGKVGDNDMYSYNYNYNNECEDSSAAVVVFDTVEVALDDTAREAAMKFVLAMWLALAFVLGGELFQPRHAFAFDSASAFSGSATTMVLSGGSSVKDSDIVDFSMPSYETAARAEVNSNLKGDNYLLGEASKNYDGGSVESSGSDSRQSTTRETSKPVTIVDEKAQKAEAKAAAKAARARQQAEIEIEIAARTAAASN